MSYQTPRGFKGLVHDPKAKHEMRITVEGYGSNTLKVDCQCKHMTAHKFKDLAEARFFYLEHILDVSSE